MDILRAFTALMGLNEVAFAGAHLAAACHALEAALDIAVSVAGRAWLDEVAERAQRQADWLDAHPPDLSCVSVFCAARGNRDRFHACAEAARGLLDARR